MEAILIREKHYKLFRILYKNRNLNLTKLAWATEITYNHLKNMLNFYAKRNIIEFKNLNGRAITCNLTPKGRKLLNYLKKIDELLNKKEVENE